MVDIEVPRDRTGRYNLNKVRNLEMRCESMKHRKRRNARTAERRTLQAIGDVLCGRRHRRTKPETPGSNLLVLLLVTRNMQHEVMSTSDTVPETIKHSKTV
jgi:hypothetical protein